MSNQQLVPIFKSQGGKDVVSARILWEFLCVSTEFAKWFSRRVEEYGFKEGVDFSSFKTESTGGRPAIDYCLSLCMAQRLQEIDKIRPRYDKIKRELQGTYLLACHEATAVKIGLASDVKRRIFDLQAGNPYPLELLLYLPINIEKKLHRKFKHLHMHREWFRLGEDILLFVEACKSGVLLAEVL